MIRSNYLRIIICVVFLFVLFAYPSPAKACSCLEPGHPSSEFYRADSIFTGRAIRIVDNYQPVFSFLDQAMIKLGIRSYRFYEGRFYGYSVFFAVDKSWKGVQETVVEIHTGYGGGDCGYSFTVGQDYLVYANYAYGKPGNYWMTGICSRTAETANATDDFNYLTTLSTLPLNSAFPIPWTEKDLIFLLILLLITTGIVISIKRRQQQHSSD